MTNEGYLRTPSVLGDTVVFASEDDLWSVPLAGGVARRLTAGLGDVQRPRISPDGTRIAFTSREEHHNEIFVMPAQGGPARRLTYLGATVALAAGWTPDGRIVFRSDHAQPFIRIHALWTIGPNGGEPQRLPYGPAHEIAFGPRGGVVLGRHTIDPARWKRYRGGTAGHLWVDARAKGSFKRILENLDTNLAHPMWVGDRIYLVSDHEGIGNVYSCTPDGKDVRRHTDHDEFYARFASTDGRTIVYQHAAELWALDVETDRARRIDVDLASPRTQRNRRFVDAADFLQGYDVHPDGHSIALEVRGKAFTMPLWEGAVHEHGAPAGVRYRLAHWLPDGERVVVLADEDGEERLEIHRPDGKRKRLDAADVGRAHALAPNPARNLVAIANHRHELLVVDLDSGSVTVADRSRFQRVLDPVWSADGAWLAYAIPETMQTQSIKLLEVSSGKPHAVTPPDFRDYAPAFDPEGKYLYFLSFRTFDPVYDAHFFDLGFPRGSRPYAVALRGDVPHPFVPEPKGLGAKKDDDDDKEDEKEKKPEPVRIELEGITERIVAFPVPESRYEQIQGIKGKALFTSFPVQGSLAGGDWYVEPDERGSLEVFDFAEQKHEVLFGGVGSFAVARDGKTLVYRSGKRLRAVKAGERPDEKFEKDPPSRRSGWIDVGRARCSVDPGAEWRQMFRESWRLQRDNFWTPDMSGVDWQRVHDRYRPLVDKVASRLEFSDLIWDFQGELGTSHAYEMGGDIRRPPAYPLGYLGADLAWDARRGGYRVEHIVRGDPWDDDRRSPLAAIGAGVREGDVILAVNGRTVSRDLSPQAFLVNQAGQMVELTVARARKTRTVLVKTLRNETPARYREWVERNRARVHDATNGRVGYVHVPDMGPAGYAEFHRYYLSEVDRPALIVDVRFNGGGHVSQLIAEKLARRRLGYDIPRYGEPYPYPSDSVLGPIVAVTNEQAGSDGDIFSHVFKLLRIGTLVGKRTWGGVVGIWVRHRLADGGVTTQPEFSNWFTDVGFGLENRGTDPDVDVDIAPQDYAAGRDPQLDKALQLITAAMKRTPPKLPDFGKRRKLPLPKLPKRRSR